MALLSPACFKLFFYLLTFRIHEHFFSSLYRPEFWKLPKWVRIWTTNTNFKASLHIPILDAYSSYLNVPKMHLNILILSIIILSLLVECGLLITLARLTGHSILANGIYNEMIEKLYHLYFENL